MINFLFFKTFEAEFLNCQFLKWWPHPVHRVDSIISGRSPPLHCTLTLISMQGHQNHIPVYLRVLHYSVVIWSYMVLEKLK